MAAAAPLNFMRLSVARHEVRQVAERPGLMASQIRIAGKAGGKASNDGSPTSSENARILSSAKRSGCAQWAPSY